MGEIQVRRLRDHLADTLARVQEGERIVIMKHRRPVAELVPVGKGDTLERRLDAFAARGMMIRARRRASVLGKGFKGFPALNGTRLVAQVLKDRR